MMYRVTEIKGVFPAQFGQQRVAFSVEGNPNQLSGFFKVVPTVGGDIEGEIVQKGQYWNFVTPKKAASVASPDATILYISRNVDATLQAVQMLTSKMNLLVKRLEMKGVLDVETDTARALYPEMEGEPMF